jgi:hypothetical protein
MSGYRDRIAQRIKSALADGQKHKRMLCQALDCEYTAIDPTMAQMIRDGSIVILGTAKQAGYLKVNKHAPVYGLPGMTLKPYVAEEKKETGPVYPDDIRIAQPRTIPQYHSNGWSRLY